MTSVAVITIAHGRHAHLAGQVRALARSTVQPDHYIVVAMDDPGIDDIVGVGVGARGTGRGATVIHLPARTEQLPLSAARNVGAAAAIASGAEVLVFLDVDCLPSPGLLEAYVAAALDPTTGGDLLCGPVSYLSPPPSDGYDLDTLEDVWTAHPARPAPDAGTVVRGGDPQLFWSLSFALTAYTWQRIGGFCELYVGYGGEDTDFAQLAVTRGIELAWVGGARAHHQYHPTTSPPVQHVDAILRNGAIFHSRWGWWPMGGWLDAFEARGLVARTPDKSGWVRLAEPVPLSSNIANST